MRNPKSFRFTSWLSEFTFFRLTPRALRLTVFFLSLSPLLFSSPSEVNAQWEPDRRLTYDDTISYTSSNKSLAVGSTGVVHVVWRDNRDGNTEIYYKRSTDAGATWDSADTRLTYNPYISEDPVIASGGSIVHVVWEDSRDGNFEIYYKRSTDSGATWSSDLRLTNAPGYSFIPDLSVFDSLIHLVWRDDRDGNWGIYYKRSTDAGVSWTPDSCLTSNPIAVDDPSVSCSGSFTYLVWPDDRSWEWVLYYKRSMDGGVTWDTTDNRLSFTPDNAYSPSISSSDSNVHVAWQVTPQSGQGGRIFYKHSTDFGTLWSQDTCLVDSAVLPSLVVSGSMVHLVWCDGRHSIAYNLYYKKSTDNGVTWSSDMCLTNTTRSAFWPTIRVSGPVVHVNWTDNRYGNGKEEVFYKRNPSGNAVEENSELGSRKFKIRLNARPNPFTSFTALPGHEAERFALYDISGRRVGTYRGDRVGADLTPGVYFIKPEEKQSKPLRIVKLR